MIIGKGLIASQFYKIDRDDVIFFASGVSNSLEKNPKEFLREENLIKETLLNFPNLIIIYFSTCSVYDSSKHDSPYVLHKLHMEEIIRNSSNKYMIMRVSNAVGKGGNPNLLLNYLFHSLKNEKPLTIHSKAKRNLIDVEDVMMLTSILLEDKLNYNKIFNLAFKTNFDIITIVNTFKKQLGFETTINKIDIGESYSIDINEINFYFKDIESDIYLTNLVNKYYK